MIYDSPDTDDATIRLRSLFLHKMGRWSCCRSSYETDGVSESVICFLRVTRRSDSYTVWLYTKGSIAPSTPIHRITRSFSV